MTKQTTLAEPVFPKNLDSMRDDDWLSWINNPKNMSVFIKSWSVMQDMPDHEKFKKENFWPFEVFHMLISKEPHMAWILILKLIETDLSDLAFSVLAAGPLEDLLSTNSEDIIQKTELEARRNPKFFELLCGVWQNGMTNKNWARINKITAGKKW